MSSRILKLELAKRLEAKIEAVLEINATPEDLKQDK